MFSESIAGCCDGQVVQKRQQRCRQWMIQPPRILTYWKEWMRLLNVTASSVPGRQYLYINCVINCDQGFGHEGSLCKMVMKNLIILVWERKFRPDLVLVSWKCLFTLVWNKRPSQQCTDGTEWAGRKWSSHNYRYETAFRWQVGCMIFWRHPFSLKVSNMYFAESAWLLGDCKIWFCVNRCV